MVSNERLFIDGDIDTLYERNKKLMFHIANKFSNLKLEYDDFIGCGDLAFVKATKKFDPNKSKWATFFSTIMVNEILMVNRNLNKQSEIISIETVICSYSEQNVLTLQDIIPELKDTMDDAINLMTIKEILELSKKLSPKKCEIFGLYLLEMKQKDIGTKLNLSQSYVARLIKRICIELKDAYEKGA
ncbi:sigma-70 family RNA polymerase sigma factor [Clostridium vincentii]|uniref:RNA polymerase sigma-35 factor n=1 Tax=Clostridium vincentii TaxID=52704 RepID=A0A2T0BL10_9CLOT|nr:sigma-70 family RNA polymerase sigma factor [Clostridium vincentii]PRR84549.1 RNA polymerase sigma-35 factor precursor [Clostridium vincentii]